MNYRGLEGLKVLSEKIVYDPPFWLIILFILSIIAGAVGFLIIIDGRDNLFNSFIGFLILAVAIVIGIWSWKYEDVDYFVTIKVTPINEKNYYVDTNIWKYSDSDGEIIELHSNEKFKNGEDHNLKINGEEQ